MLTPPGMSMSRFSRQFDSYRGIGRVRLRDTIARNSPALSAELAADHSMEHRPASRLVTGGELPTVAE
jgi:hypothetical protein